MGFNENKFLSPLFKLFGKRLAGVPPSPANLDIIQFNSTSGQWELSSGVVGNAVQSSSNVGGGFGLALPRVLDDLPFKSILAGTGISIVVTPTTIEIINTQMTSPVIFAYHSDKNWKLSPDIRFGAPFTNKQDQATETDAQFVAGCSYTAREITIFVPVNSSVVASTITLKRNSVAIPATTITIPALTTGIFSVSGLSEVFTATDEMHEEHSVGVGGADNDINSTSWCVRADT